MGMFSDLVVATMEHARIEGPPSKNRKEYPYEGQLRIPGLPLILVENAAGSPRRGTSPDGNMWTTHMKMHYGEFQGTEGADGDPVDVFVGPDPLGSGMAFIVHQQDPDTKEYDECKVLLGFGSKASALRAYRAHYDRPGFVGTVSRMSVADLGKWLRDPGNKGRKIEGSPMSKGMFTQMLEAVLVDP